MKINRNLLWFLALVLTGAVVFSLSGAASARSMALLTATVTPSATVEVTPATALPLPQTPGSITVSGSAQVLVEPDEVILTVGVETSDLDLNFAKRKNDDIIKEILAITQEFKIEPKHVQTDFINIEPRYDSSFRQENFIGYFVRKTVEIRLKEISQFEGLYTAILESGANYVHNVEFHTSQLRQHRDQARELAIQAAREKGEALASAVGLRLGAVKMIHEDHNDWYGSYNRWWGWGSSGAYQNVVQNVSGGSFSEEGTLAPGQISITAGVTVEFELIAP